MNISDRRDHDDGHVGLVLRWKGGAITELTVPARRKPPSRLRTDEDTVDLIRRLAAFYPDAKIAGILNRQGRTTARGMRYTASGVQSLRHHWKSPATSRPATAGRRTSERDHRRRVSWTSHRPSRCAG